MNSELFDDIRPFRNDEIPEAMNRIASSEQFPLLASYVYPHADIEKVRMQIRQFRTVRDFQLEVMRCVNEQVIARSITEFSYGGIERLDPEKKYLFVSNHRDIMLDACLLQYILYKNGHETSEITFGANLMQGQLVTDIGKSNKMFRVERPGTNPREFYKSSLHLSEYIRFTLLEKNESVWIAQRNGRTKDGIDRTDQGIIKMFGMSKRKDKVEALAELQIVPVSISYEWESCDILKTLELYASQFGKYEKKPGEDLNSILTGILQPKGKVHVELCDMVTREDLLQYEGLPDTEYNRQVANLLDKRICTAYCLTPNNYIAHDMRSGQDVYAHCYTETQKAAFQKYLRKLDEFQGRCEVERLREILVGIYANPVDSKFFFTNQNNNNCN